MTAADNYADRVFAAVVRGEIPEAALRRTCPECGMPPADDPAAHVTASGYVVVGCEGYWVVDPALVGIDRPNWQAAP